MSSAGNSKAATPRGRPELAHGAVPKLPLAEGLSTAATSHTAGSSATPARSARLSVAEGGTTPAGEATVRVQVAARIRPLLQWEAAQQQAESCAQVSSTSVFIGRSCFTFDHAFGPEATQEDVYSQCVEPLVDATFEGVHGTLLAYGQTGSGKTYTMGTSGLPDVPPGAVQRAVQAIFTRAEELEAEGCSTSFRASYVEIFTDSKGSEDMRDLLCLGRGAQAYAALKADADGQVRLSGLSEHEVRSSVETLRLLSLGSAARATSSTRLNNASSRSHAIFSLQVIQGRQVGGVSSTLTAKFQFVDLAGSEKVKISGAEGEQLSQAININHGLFVLGKAITALSEGQPHVPFRESKLTRILQNSLGGNSRTCMIVCASPSDVSLAETLSALTYAAKAKEIRNKPMVNRAAACANCASLQARIEALEAASANASSRGDVVAASAKRSVQDAVPFGAARAMENMDSEIVRLRDENQRLAVSLEQMDTATGSCDEAGLRDLREKLERTEALYNHCCKKLAAAVQDASEQGAQGAHFGHGSGIMPSDDDDGESSSGQTQDELDFENEEEREDLIDAHGGSDEDMDSGLFRTASAEVEAAQFHASSFEADARRKQRLLLKIEENHHAMALLEAQAQERIKQHEAAQEIAERELARVRGELESAKKQKEKLAHVQERYDQRLAALKEKNLALERERKESQRLKTLQKQQETRLRVLQEAMRSSKEERDKLKDRLHGELARRKEESAQGLRARKADQATIRKLQKTVTSLERAVERDLQRAARNGTVLSGRPRRDRPKQRRHSPSSSRGRAQPQSSGSRAYCQARGSSPRQRPLDGGGVWEQLLNTAVVHSERSRRIQRAEDRLSQLRHRMLELGAQREQRLQEAELTHLEAYRSQATAAAEDVQETEAEHASLVAAADYQKETVWMLRKESQHVVWRGWSDEMLQATQDMTPAQLRQGLIWMGQSAARQADCAAVVREECRAAAAEEAAGRAALRESEHRLARLEQAFDAARDEYESRVAYLLARLNNGDTMEKEALQEALGEDALSLLARRVAELEDALAQAKEDAKKQGRKKVEQDLELIASCRHLDEENKQMRTRLNDADSRIERAVQRGAQREALLLQQVSALEGQVAALQQERQRHREAERLEEGGTGAATPSLVPDVSRSTKSAESFTALPGGALALEALESFWRSTGLEVNKKEFLNSLKDDIEKLCERRLSDHLEWQKDLEATLEQLCASIGQLEALLGERADAVPAGANLLQQRAWLEASLETLNGMREEREAELQRLSEIASQSYLRLHELQPAVPLPTATTPRALHEASLQSLRDSAVELRSLERAREAHVYAQAAIFKDVWEQLGLRLPGELEALEARLLEEQPPISDSYLAYLEGRLSRLSALQEEWKAEEAQLDGAVRDWRQRLEAFPTKPLPEAPEALPLARSVHLLRQTLQEAEETASTFLQDEAGALAAFATTARLPCTEELLSELQQTEGLTEKLAVLQRNWERCIAQRSEHYRIAELIASREALQKEMRDFDSEASDPNRFRRRGYSGVQESKRRAEYQQRLKALDSSLSVSIGEWLQREGSAFCLGGVAYRGAELLPAEHTHMYAWTNRQLSQAATAGQSGESGGQVTPRRTARGSGAASPAYPAATHRNSLPTSRPTVSAASSSAPAVASARRLSV
eukprot:TRINITY_DN51404_c0_g2_i1.p1 TRINITY_DN51404_c0_g2~~TRINITY_DN51404_c0_g2_i1.p1  ORF type:complete len:1669 (+),score=439.28 TRINITY_DN51404_c0_g2_i1:162-5168(+)